MKTVISLLILTLALTANASESPKAKNVILMIADGLGFNEWEAGRNYQGSLQYDDAGFDFYGCTNYSEGFIDNPVHGSYDSSQYWSDFSYQHENMTDSAAAATALYTGTKTYITNISVDTNGNALTTIAEYAAYNGKATGAVTSIGFSHATPGAVDAHNISRDNLDGIAIEMLNSDLDVIMGGDNRTDSQYLYDLANNNGFDIINDSNLSAWEDLANGTIVTDKVFGTVNDPSGTIFGHGTPTLDLMAQGALNVLNQNEDGFFLMIEGGVVDFFNHHNHMDYAINEILDFNNTVESVMEWIEANGGWEENLLIVTADHESGGIWGGVGEFEHVGNPGEGVMPTFASIIEGYEENGIGVDSVDSADVVFNSNSHTNALVPLWTKGAGSDMFAGLVDGIDSQADAFWSEEYGWDWDGSYVDNTDVFEVMFNSEVPEPTTIALLALGGFAALRRHRF